MGQRVDGKNKNYPVTIALIGLVGTLGSALIMGWVNLNKDSSPKKKVNYDQRVEVVNADGYINDQDLLPNMDNEAILSDELAYKEEEIYPDDFTHEEGIVDSGEEFSNY
ncbi:MAG: hypothetical protein D3910_03900 [Candidatus Electrothrix sp. ATG2]|nr:hypothetical protein [Candidatus Electrothrix sp. ATG2]